MRPCTKRLSGGVLLNLVDGADVGMIQGRSSFGFALEAAEGLLIFGHFIGQELEGHKATGFDILGLVDHTHPTAPELLVHETFNAGKQRRGLTHHCDLLRFDDGAGQM